jgi:hypothetical protein
LPYQKGLRNPAGWLRKAIEQGYELPDTVPLPDALSEGYPSSHLVSDDNDQGSLGADQNHVPDTDETELLSPLVADPSAEAVWEPLLKELSQQINSPSLLVWFEGIVPAAFEDSTLVLRVPNRFALQYVEARFGELMRRVLKEQVGSEAKLVVQAPKSTSSAESTSSS